MTVNELRFDLAGISWTTNEATTSVVQYGTTTSYGLQTAAVDNSTSHTAVLRELNPATTYHLRIVSTDNAGNKSTSSDYTIVTPAEPVGFIKNWLVVGPYTDTNGSGFNTDYLSNESSIKPSIGTTTGGRNWKQYSSPTDFINLGNASGLADNQVGYAHVYINTSAAKTVRLLLGSDDAVKVCLNGTIVHSNDVGRSATPDDDTVTLNLTQGWNRLLIKVTNQEGDWGFYARIVDASGAAVPGLSFVLNAPAVSDTTAPTISLVKSTQVSSSQMNVSWTTNEAATSVVEYGTSTSYGKTASVTGMITSHSVPITGLSAGVTYHYRVKSADAAGNLAVSGDYTMTIPAAVTTSSYLRNWLLIGPFDNTSRKGYSTNYIGESTITPSAGTVTAGKTWKTCQSTTDLINLKNWVTTSNYRVAYAHIYVYSPSKVTCQLRTGSDDGIKIWLNGSLILNKRIERSASPDAEKTQITLKAGWNRLLLKVDNVEDAWGFYARITDTQGKPVPNLKYQLNKP
jgi:hypothetical protein